MGSRPPPSPRRPRDTTLRRVPENHHRLACPDHRPQRHPIAGLGLTDTEQNRSTAPPMAGRRPVHKVKKSECGQARKGDGLTASWSEVTCPGCLAGRAGERSDQLRNNLAFSDHLAGYVPHMNATSRPVTADGDPVIAARVAAAMKGRRRRRR